MTNNLQNNHHKDIVFQLKNWIGIVLYISILAEVVFFPSLPNLAGCLMVWSIWIIFKNFFLKNWIILKHPFSFIAFLSFFLSRYIPLPATLLEGKPITYGFELPFATFFWETVMFMVASLAFYCVISNSSYSNNTIQRLLYKFHFFDSNPRTLWILGFIGVGVKIQQLAVSGEVEFGDVNNKFLAGLIYLQYSPLIMFFPTLSGVSSSKRRNKMLILYTCLIFLISIASNSRQSMIFPIITIVLLFFIYLVKNNYSIFKFLSPVNLFLIVFFLFFGLSFISDLSLAMIYNRSLRSDIGRGELFSRTVETLRDEEVMKDLRTVFHEKIQSLGTYREGWTEDYLNNFMLNRYGNIRISDQTLFYADKVGFGDEAIRKSFFNNVWAIIPTPILSFIGYPINKEELAYSPGDFLYYRAGGPSSALGGYRVTSLVADGLATFGYVFFPFIFILLLLFFLFLDSFVYIKNGHIVYASIGLINVFYFFGIFRHANGTLVPINFIIRGFWQLCFTFWIIVTLIQFIPLKRNT